MKTNQVALTLRFNGKPLRETWKKIPQSMHDTEPDLPWSNFVRYLLGNLVMSADVKNLIEDLDSDFEWLQLPYSEKDIFVLNILNPVDCLDSENSECSYFESGGKKILSAVSQWSFFISKLDPNKSLFKIPEMLSSDIFCTEGFLPPEKEFKHIVESNGFTGLKFKEVWSDE